MENEEKKYLLNIARAAIKAGLENTNFKADLSQISKELLEKRATFVTLTIHSDLRGCIGHLVPIQELYKDVIENAQAAAFSDPRFRPLLKDELSQIKIEISILGPSKKFTYQSPEKLVQYLEENKPGVTLSKNGYSATFLPQVWEELPDAPHFLDHLCLKAGLDPYEWQRGVEIEIYTVDKFEEK
jgi:AmmeMemoRadiSam system protein A